LIKKLSIFFPFFIASTIHFGFRDLEAAKEVLGSLRDAGVRIALDDFGAPDIPAFITCGVSRSTKSRSTAAS
jgi:hypothetical protein